MGACHRMVAASRSVNTATGRSRFASARLERQRRAGAQAVQPGGMALQAGPSISRRLEAHGELRIEHCDQVALVAEATGMNPQSRAVRPRPQRRPTESSFNIEWNTILSCGTALTSLCPVTSRNVGHRVESMSCALDSKNLAGQPWACPGHRSWHSAATDGRDKSGHDGESDAKCELGFLLVPEMVEHVLRPELRRRLVPRNDTMA